MTRRIIISGGGTGGHIFPALAIADALRKANPEVEILFVGAEGKMEMQRVPEAGYKIVGLPVQGFIRRLTLRNVKVLLNLQRSLRRARRLIREFAPEVVVGVGGYASAPICRAASRAGIPVVLQEQNSYAGVTNKLLAEKAALICTAYDHMDRFFPKEKILLTGNPLRGGLARASREEGLAFFGLDADKQTILVTGGSLGAGHMNDAVEKWIETLPENVQVIWQCGGYYFKTLSERVEGKLPRRVHLTAFVSRMDLAYAVADIVVARAGAGTISELSLLGKAVILVPSPNVAEDHQTKNAMALVEKGAAVMIPDAAVSNRLPEVAESLLADPARIEALEKSILTFGRPEAAAQIAAEILKIVNR